MPTKLRTCAFGLTSLVRPKGLSNLWRNFSVALHAINACRLPLASLVYTLVRPPPIPPAPVALEGQQVAIEIIAAHTAWIKGLKKIDGLMLMTMEPEIQRNLENLHAHEMLQELKTLFAQQAEQELLQTMRDFYSCKQKEGQNNAPALHAIRAGKVQKGNKKHKPQPQLAAMGQNQENGKISSIMLSSPRFLLHPIGKILLRTPSVNNTGIQAIGKGNVLRPKIPRKLKPDALSLYVGNGQCAAVEAIGSYHLSLPSGLVIVLNNCHYAPSITRGIISVSRLYDGGYCNISYFQVAFGLYRDAFSIILDHSFTQDSSSIYALSNKRSKSNLDSTLLWHCRLGHISKKRIEKLQRDGLLNSTDLMAFKKCIPCMSGKMARKTYTHQVEMTKDLLGLIHTNVCGPFKIMSRQGASYFVTFIDDFSRYGYVYLLKHKHEVFETFKVFQMEVENQLGKIIKSLRSLDHLKDHRIIAHRTPPYTPQHNGVSKSRNKILLDMVRSMMSQTTLLQSFWDYALETGYPKKTMGYSFYYPPENKVLVAQNAEFLENSLITQEASGSLEDLKIIQEEDTHPSIDTSLNHENDRMCLYIDAEKHELGDLGEPANYKAALLDLESDKWLNALFKKKTDMDRAVNTYKARLVAKGYTQTPWIDYKESFFPVADIRAIRILIAIAAFYDTEICQNRDEPCVYLKASGSNITFLIMYVDDILIMRNNIPMLQDVKSYLERCFAMKDLGEAAYILGIKIYRDRSWRLIGLCQSANIDKILKRYHMENSKHRSILMQDKLRLSKSQGASTLAELKRMQYVPYASTVGSIMYVVICTRPDVANTKDMFLDYGGDIKRELKVSCYTDAGYLTDVDDLKSQTGNVFVLNGGVADWNNAKQSIFATSCAEAEYIAAFDASKKAVWVRKIISRLGVVPTIKEPISMYYDYTGAITIANELRITKGARHFRAKVHYLREGIEYGDLELEKVHTYDKLADPFTKALAFSKHSENTKNIRMLSASSLM
nr:hypothetical protein [Tanacetum cinerariifolium]